MNEVLHFSGGRDSVATLWLLKPRWEHLTVMWVNTGAAYDDSLEMMAKVAKLVPHFHEVISDQPANIALHGYPADNVPRHSTVLGQMLTEVDGPRFQSAHDCCSRNLWLPLMNATRELGARVVYRGQRRQEQYRTPITSGITDENGVKYVFPIDDWTESQVRRYIVENCPDLWPDYYDRGELTSHDCWDCTAWLDVSVPRIRALAPDRRITVLGRLAQLDLEQRRENVPLHELLGGSNGINTGPRTH